MTQENGKSYTEIDNDMIEKIAMSKDYKESTRIWAVAARQTNGWHEGDDWISRSQFMDKTGIEKRNIDRAINKAIEEKKIYKSGNRYSLYSVSDKEETSKWKSEKEEASKWSKKTSKWTEEKTSKWTDTKSLLKTTQLKHGDVAKPLSRKEINLLEGMEYFRAEMINDGNFELKFIDDLIKKYKYMVLYDSWLEYVDASNIKKPVGFFLSLVEKYQKAR